MSKFRASARLHGECGGSLMELALVLPVLFALLFGAVDYGRMYFMAIEVAGAADAGAAYGTQNVKDSTGIQAVVLADAPDATSLSSTSVYGCECADGTNYSLSCASTPTCSANVNVVYRVDVTVNATYTPIIPWPGIPSSTAITDTAEMRSGSI